MNPDAFTDPTTGTLVPTIAHLINLQTEYRAIAAATGRTATAISLVDFLFERPAITISEAKDRLKITYPAAKSTVDKLVDAGILRTWENTYPKVFHAPAIMRASRPVEPDPEQDRRDPLAEALNDVNT